MVDIPRLNIYEKEERATRSHIKNAPTRAQHNRQKQSKLMVGHPGLMVMAVPVTIEIQLFACIAMTRLVILREDKGCFVPFARDGTPAMLRRWRKRKRSVSVIYVSEGHFSLSEG